MVEFETEVWKMMAEHYEFVTDSPFETEFEGEWDHMASSLRSDRWSDMVTDELAGGAWLDGCRPPTSPPGEGEGVVWFHGSAFPLIVKRSAWSEAVRCGGVDLDSCEFWNLPSHEGIRGYRAEDHDWVAPAEGLEDFGQWGTWWGAYVEQLLPMSESERDAWDGALRRRANGWVPSPCCGALSADCGCW